jgi:gliding motility-associated-like protein
LLLCAVCKSYAQTFYVCTSSLTLQKVTITPGGVQTQNVSGCGGGFFSIAVSGNKLYYNSGAGILYSAYIKETPDGTTLENCKLLPVTAYGNALTVGKDGLIYSVSGSELFTIDPITSQIKSLGIMPYSAAGDLVFYNNELYMAAYEGIVKIPLNNIANSKLYIPMPNQSIFGLATIVVNNIIKAYAFTGSSGNTLMYELDMQNKLVKGVVATLPFTVFDAGSVVESGEEPPIEITSVNILQECNVVNKGRAEVVTKAHASEYTYTLNNGESNKTGIFDNLIPGAYKVTVKANGQPEKSQDFIVPNFMLNNPVITATIVNPVCDIKGSIKLEGGAGYKIKFNNNVFDMGYKFTDLASGAYHFTILTPAGCIADEKDYRLTQEVCPPITVNEIQVNPMCDSYGAASVTVLTQAHPDNYTYTLNGTANTTGVFNNLKPGTFSLIITSSGGDRKEIQVIVPDFKIVNKPALIHKVKNAVCTLAGQVTFNANGDIKGAATIKYGTNSYTIGQTIKGLPVGSIHFTVLNKQGCILDELDIIVDEDRCEPVDFPDAFTPNGDGVNDIFRPNQESNPIQYKLIVFNRNGQQVFQSLSTHNGWDGYYNGRQLPTGVYYWICTYTMGDYKTANKKGWVTLLR